MVNRGVWDLSTRHHLREVATLIDVGTNRGTPDLYDAVPDAYYVLIEPLEERTPDLEQILEHHHGEYVIAAVGSTAAASVLHVEVERKGMSSLLHRTDLVATGGKQEERKVPVVTLDAVHTSLGLRAPVGIKIDTEGYELEVLRGAREVLPEAAWVIAEVSVVERFHDSYRPHELLDEMRQQGFVVADIIRTTRGFADLLFVPDGRSAPTHPGEPDRRRPRSSLNRLRGLAPAQRKRSAPDQGL